VLLYSVCTFTTSETTAVVADFLARHKEYELDGLGQAVPKHWRELIGPDGMLHTFPHRHDGMDAFFAARLRRR
jgi:16S rRNA (cytosine967-C5)-methyltransferase